MKFPFFMSPYFIFGDGVGGVGTVGVWYVTDKRRPLDERWVLACASMADAQAGAREMEKQDARNAS